MPIDSLHPSYDHYKNEFCDCRNAFEGGRAIKRAGERYLPRLKNQQNNDYEAYKGRALFFSITSKTVSAMVGMVMVREPIIQQTGLDSYFTENQGAQFLEICSTTVQEVLLMGGYGIFLDAPVDGGDPILCRYTRESVINWRVDDRGRPTLIVLEECVLRQKSDDEYAFEEKKQYRKLWMRGKEFIVTVYDDQKQPSNEFVPMIRRVPMDHIPFYMINPLGVSMDVIKPPMLDIVDLNISHYKTSADLEHGRHFTGLPTPVVIGVDSADLYVGSSAAWVLPDPNADAKFLEFTGQGLQSLEKAMVEKQGQMASMSARMLDNSKRGSEAADTVKLRYMSETAGLVTVVRSVEDGLNQVYGEIADIKGEAKPVLQMNKEFMDPKLSAADLTAIVKAYIEGAISKDTLIYNLRKGDIISVKEDDAEFIAELDQRRKERLEAEKPTPTTGE